MNINLSFSKKNRKARPLGESVLIRRSNYYNYSNPKTNIYHMKNTIIIIFTTIALFACNNSQKENRMNEKIVTQEKNKDLTLIGDRQQLLLVIQK